MASRIKLRCARTIASCSRAAACPSDDSTAVAAATQGSGNGAMIRRSKVITPAFASRQPMRAPTSAQALDKVRSIARLS